MLDIALEVAVISRLSPFATRFNPSYAGYCSGSTSRKLKMVWISFRFNPSYAGYCSGRSGVFRMFILSTFVSILLMLDIALEV